MSIRTKYYSNCLKCENLPWKFSHRITSEKKGPEFGPFGNYLKSKYTKKIYIWLTKGIFCTYAFWGGNNAFKVTHIYFFISTNCKHWFSKPCVLFKNFFFYLFFFVQHAVIFKVVFRSGKKYYCLKS